MASSSSDARTAILGAIRDGLAAGAVPMPFPESEGAPLRQLFVQPEGGRLEEAFAEAFMALGGRFIYCTDTDELVQNLHALIDSRDWQYVLCTEPPILQALQQAGTPVHPADPPMESADACITGCEALVARTGSVILSSAQAYGRTATVYYPVHIIVARASQVVADIEDGLTRLKDIRGNWPSMVHLNTGPSRTADIEKTLVVGVHGPGEVFLFLVND